MCSEIQQMWHSNTDVIFTYLLILTFQYMKERFYSPPAVKYNSLVSSIKKFQFMQHPRLTANLIQFRSPAAHDHCKQIILRIGKIHCTGVCTLNKIHSSRAEGGKRKSRHSVKRTSLRHSLKKENKGD